MGLAKQIKRSVDPIVQSVAATADTVQRTTAFTSEMVVRPGFKMVTVLGGAAQVFTVLRRGWRRR